MDLTLGQRPVSPDSLTHNGATRSVEPSNSGLYSLMQEQTNSSAGTPPSAIQWLAAEDAMAKGDRIAGIHWIWSDEKDPVGTVRYFRFTFDAGDNPRRAELAVAGSTLESVRLN